MNSVISNNLSLKYKWFKPSGCKEIGNIKFDFVAKTQSLLLKIAVRDQMGYFSLLLCRTVVVVFSRPPI